MMKIKEFSFILAAAAGFLFSLEGVSPAAELPRAEVPASETTILAPEGLESKEQAQLEQQYRFEYRNKQALLSPYVPPAGGAAVEAAELTAINEREKLYRYFGIATELYKSGKTEEAIELLKYILSKQPNDKYVKNYLEKIQSEMEAKKVRWGKTTEQEARFLKSKEIRELTRDGIDFYNHKEFDTALLKFVDALSLDPGNAAAKTYLEKLKEYYLKEVRAENIVNAWETGQTEEKPLKESAAPKPTPPAENSPPGKKETLEQNAIESLRVSDYKEIFNYYMQEAQNYAKRGDLEGAYKACKMVFLIVPMAEETKLKILSEMERLSGKKEISPEIQEAGKKLLEQKEKEGAGGDAEMKIEGTADSLLDKWEFERIILGKKAENLMEETELGFRVNDIVLDKKEEKRKANYFTLGPGDVIQISVRDHPELSGQSTIKLNGEIVLPLTNDMVTAKGLTVEELTESINKAMQRYVKEPVINVMVVEYKSKIFYVVDEVGATPYPITRADFTLRDALFVADWGDNRALGRVLVIKPSKLHPIIKTVDAFDIIYRGNLVNNVRVVNGDVIYIPKTIVGKLNNVLVNTFGPMSALSGGLANSNDVIRGLRRFKGQSMQKILETSSSSGGGQ